MWNIMVLTLMASLAGYYSLNDEKILPDQQVAVARNLAVSMGTYRQAVINYATANPTATGQVTIPAAYLPTGYTTAQAGLWTNFIDPNGTIYIYPAAALPVNITAEIISLSQNSVLVGEAGASDNMLHAPADRPTPAGWANDPKSHNIPLALDYTGAPNIALTPSQPTPIVPAGSTVWLAYRN
ncbi:MAG: type IV pilus biogenesis protein PilM [Burkholderiaceae bacterium]